MKKLFQLNTKPLSFFQDKMETKKERKELNGSDADGNEVFGKGYYVSRGPDHWRVTA
jgi:hypothetical protein